MDAKFWHERWERGEIGFHQPDYHPALLRYWPSLRLPRISRVFVPLCGRSLDMIWLAGQGHPILGVELSPVAVEGFFDHSTWTVAPRKRGPFASYAMGPYEILQGDFFDLTPELTGGIDAFYDRAALVALPPDMRGRYAARMAELLAPGDTGLLLTLEYDQALMSGPPFSVPAGEVHELFDGHFDVELLSREDTLAASPRFAEKGLKSLHESAFRLARR
jgi:thiopurine S-methyltransferase